VVFAEEGVEDITGNLEDKSVVVSAGISPWLWEFLTMRITPHKTTAKIMKAATPKIISRNLASIKGVFYHKLILLAYN